jgi:hypothetical protein
VSYGKFKTNGTNYTGFGNEWRGNHHVSPNNSEVPICETSCHIQRKIEIKPRTAIIWIRDINMFCEIFKIYSVLFFLFSSFLSFHMLFHWKKTKQLKNRADPQGSADHHLRITVLGVYWCSILKYAIIASTYLFEFPIHLLYFIICLLNIYIS